MSSPADDPGDVHRWLVADGGERLLGLVGELLLGAAALAAPQEGSATDLVAALGGGEPDAAIAALTETLTAAETPVAVHDFDGVRMEFPDWWFNVRKSNTEPLLRLNLEGMNAEAFEEGKERVMRLLGTPVDK